MKSAPSLKRRRRSILYTITWRKPTRPAINEKAPKDVHAAYRYRYIHAPRCVSTRYRFARGRPLPLASRIQIPELDRKPPLASSTGRLNLVWHGFIFIDIVNESGALQRVPGPWKACPRQECSPRAAHGPLRPLFLLLTKAGPAPLCLAPRLPILSPLVCPKVHRLSGRDHGFLDQFRRQGHDVPPAER